MLRMFALAAALCVTSTAMACPADSLGVCAAPQVAYAPAAQLVVPQPYVQAFVAPAPQVAYAAPVVAAPLVQAYAAPVRVARVRAVAAAPVAAAPVVATARVRVPRQTLFKRRVAVAAPAAVVAPY